MFRITYITTLKNILRSFLFWISFVLVIFIVVSSAAKGFTGYVVVDENDRIVETVMDTDSEFKLEFQTYILTILNGLKAWVMSYALPLISIITVMIVLNRDYDDGFFEIEKANAISLSKYFFGRLLAILTVVLSVCLISCFGAVYYYYYTRGGLPEFTLISFVSDSFVRIIRVILFAVVPGVLIYLGLTLLIGNLSRNGFFGMIASSGYLMFIYASNYFLRYKLPQDYFDYYVPASDKLYQYWSFYGTEWFNEKNVHNPFTCEQMIYSVGILIVISIVFICVSFICVKRRNI